MDKSNGYEGIASEFIKVRGRGTGTSSVRTWVRALPEHSAILDLGCGSGFPISKVLIDAGMNVYGVDASPTLVKAFRQNFPDAPVECEAVEDSLFFNKTFDGIVAWGLMFLMPGEVQAKVIQKAANALKTGGKLLFTAPYKETEWKDAMTGHHSISLGAKKYKALLSASGLSLVEEFEDEGENHYYSAIKIGQESLS